MATPTYDLIETTTLDTAASSVTFSSITQDYRDLVLVIAGASTGSSKFLILQPNSDTENASFVEMVGDGSNDQSNTRTNFRIHMGNGKNTSIIQIMDYSATDKHKSIIFRDNAFNFSEIFRVSAAAGRWASTSAITSLDVVNGTADLASGTVLSLYGIAA